MRFWLDRGVAGFRVDAISHLFEVKANADNLIPDEPKSGYTNDTDDFNYLDHIYTFNQPETYDMNVQWRQLLDDFQRERGGDSRVMMTEIWGSIEEATQYYGNSTHNGSHIPFNFDFTGITDYYSTARDYSNAINRWMKYMPEHQIANWVVCKRVYLNDFH